MEAEIPPARFALGRVAADAQRQLGLFTADQARAVGLGRAIIDRRVRSGEIEVIDHHVYRSTLTPPSWHQRVLAACLAGPAVASHRSAGTLWSAPDLPVGVVEVTALRHRRRKAPDVVWHESYLLDEAQVTVLDGVPVTTATRTLLDLAAVLEPDHLMRVLDEFLRRRLTSVERVATLLERLGPRRPGYHQMGKVLARRATTVGARLVSLGPVPESDLETRFESLLRSAGLPPPTRQHRVRVRGGKELRVDFGYEPARVGMEVLGAEFHARPDRWAADIDRIALLAEVDWQVLQFGAAQIEFRPRTVVGAIEAALRRAGWWPHT